MTTPSFQWCGKFTGKTSATRWLRSFEIELLLCRDTSGNVSPHLYLQYLDLLLAEDAAGWAEINADAVRLLGIDEPTNATVTSFVSLLKQRFPGKVIETAPAITFEAELADLRQKSDENLTSYYNRALDMMHKYGAKDRTTADETLSLAEGSLLDTFLRGWIRGLTNLSIKHKCAEHMGSADRSLKKLYEVAEATRRVNAEIEKLFEEEVKEKELQFYKKIAQRNMSKT